MPRRKQDCPRRMKWEEEQALLAAAAAAGQTLPASLLHRTEQDGGMDSGEDEDSDASDASAPRQPDSWNGSGAGSMQDEDEVRSPVAIDGSAAVLDFSVRGRVASFSGSESDTAVSTQQPARTPGETPLDLSVPKRRAPHDERPVEAKQPRLSPAPNFLSPWDKRFSLHFPGAGGGLSKLGAWNGAVGSDDAPPSSQKLPPYTKSPTPSEASRALERMQELSKMTSEPSEMFRTLGQRPNVWQNQWMNRGIDQTRDVLKCVWCKLSFNTLAELTTHMREARHTSMPPVPPAASASTASSSTSTATDNISSLKETMPLPRKLVRGQDVWLGKGAEQTRQILKCMWCGQSFKSLDEMTVHMQKTQHYTNIISQEQIISWKSPDNKTATQSHVNAVLTCKVCDQAFSSLKELSSHMVKYSHYKEHIMRSISETGGRRRQAREKRKKSLPVRKLLELERAHNEMKPDRPSKDERGRVACDKCGERVDPLAFVEHIRKCTGKVSSNRSPSEASIATSDHRSVADEDEKPTIETPSGPRSALSALERLIETSLNPRQRASTSPAASYRSSSILSRLGIDDAADFSRGAGSPEVVPPRPRSSGSSVASDARYESDTAGSETERILLRNTPLRPAAESGSADELAVAKTPPVDELPARAPSASGSERALTPRSERGSERSSTPAEEPPAAAPGPANPLAALQKLCDKTDTPPASRCSSSGVPVSQAAPGTMLAFSWACNDAVMTDSILKCAFCDTPFISKGAYRHHLSKMHFVKDGVVPDPAATAAATKPSSSSAKTARTATSSPPSSSNSSVDDTPHSKFLKYTELAKQLSSKYLVD